MSYVGNVTAGGSTHLVGSTLYGTCSTAAGTAAKVVTCADFDHLFTGVTIHVKFTYSNTASNATLNVNSTGAKNLCRYGTTRVGTTTKSSWAANAVVSFTYDGTSWVMNDYIEDTDTHKSYSFAGSSSVSNDVVMFTETFTNSTDTTSETATQVIQAGTYMTINSATNGAVLNVTGTPYVTSDSTRLVTSGGVYTAIQNAMGDVAGALVYKGTVTAESSLLNTALSKGWYYIVAMPDSQTTSITIAGQTCEAGDMVIVNTAGTYTTSSALAAAVDIIQSNTTIITNAEIDTIVASIDTIVAS